MALKVDIINKAYEHLVISGLTTDPTSGELEFALDVLEDMAAEFEARNICTGYNISDDPDVNDESGLQRQFLNAFKTNLAMRLISAFGKEVPPILMSQANQSLSSMSARTAKIRQVQYPLRQARGSGSTLRYNRWRRFFRPAIEAPQSCATNNLQVGDVNDYVEHFDAYLRENEFIKSFEIQADSGLVIEEAEDNCTDILYRVRADSLNESGSVYQVVQIKITTTDGRITQREIDFNVTE